MYILDNTFFKGTMGIDVSMSLEGMVILKIKSQ